ENLNLVDKRWYLALKRGSDFIIAALGFIITLPLWLIIAPLIKITSHGPIIFKQQRVGRDNKPFIIYKFRTMKVEDNNFQPVGDHDKRITPVGRFLRQTRLDELPQLMNILKGEMSVIGPRPERPELVQELARQIPFYNIRHLIQPGVTGWDQVSGEYHSPSLEDTYKKLQYDLFYLKHCSIYLDSTIILKTIATVLSRGGK
ncbi:MAG TPA: sugar transferase, partial [bacterium]|nr:sugar transferase [bacterium]HQI94691.1 sugar transferase [bacterium]